jgi:hypothetical protein
MNNTRGSTPPNPSLDPPNRSTGLNKTLGTIGTPHEESIAKFNPTKTCPNKRNRRNPTKTSYNPRTPKTPEFTDLGGESQPKEPRRVPTNFPHQIPKSKVPKTPQRKPPREGFENHHEEQPGTTQQGLEEPRRIIYTCHKGSYKV